MRAESWIERVLFENLKGLTGGLLLIRRQLAPTAPEGFGGAEAIVYLSPGYGWFNAVSKSTTRPAAMSSMPCLNSSGIHESSCSKTNLTTCARSAGGSSLNSAMTCCALMVLIMQKKKLHASRRFPASPFVGRNDFRFIRRRVCFFSKKITLDVSPPRRQGDGVHGAQTTNKTFTL